MKKFRRLGPAVAAGGLAVAALGVAVAQQRALLVAPRTSGVPADASPAATQPDADNTGRPEDPGMPPMPGGMMDQAAVAGMQVYVDDSFESVEKLRSAIRLQRNSQSREAIAAYQTIIQDFGQKLVYLNDKSYVSITDYVHDRLLEMPAVKTGMYDQLYGAEARKAIDAAIDDRDLSTLLRLCDRYYPSTAALKGLSQAADWYFERGEFSAAAETWLKLLKHPLAGAMQPELLFRAATAQSLAGSADRGKALRDRLAKDYADATGTVSGKQVNLLARLDDLMQMPAWDNTNAGGDEWPAFDGGPSRSALLKTDAAIGARLWSVPLHAAAGDSEGSTSTVTEINGLNGTVTGSRIQTQGDPTMLPSQPVLSNASLFIDAGNQIISISANAGTRMWIYPPAPAPGDAVIRNNVARSMGHDSASVFGDQVFAMLPVNPNTQMQYDSVGTPSFPTRIVCLRRDEGTQIWSRSASDVKTEKEGQLTFVGSPLVTRQGVFIMARKGANNGNGFIQQYLVRLDRDTGTPTWACYLCSTSTINQGINGNIQGINPSIPVPTLVDDVLYVCTGQGADCAIDANVGRILWLRVAPRHGVSSASAAPWKFNPPIVVGDLLLICDAGRTLRVYDRRNGKLLHEYAPDKFMGQPPMGGPNIDVLAGAAGSKVLMSLGNVSVCVDASELEKDNPSPDWREPITNAGKPMGRPFLTLTGYYVPFDSALVRFSIDKGNYTQVDWPKDERDQPGRPGNLLVTSEQVIVVNDTEVAGYSKWETARDNRLARIRANPRDPSNYLDLAEIAFRTSNSSIAQENMKSAVDLANAGNAPPGKSVADVLDRLYRTNLVFAEQLLGKNDNDTRDSSRFYFEQCRAVARTPEQQAQWRLRLAELSLKQKKPDEAVLLYSEVLADPAIRAASYREGDVLQSAGSTAEQRIRPLKDRNPDVYKRFEDQAAMITQRGTAAKDTAALQQVIDSFPNSAASIKAATTLSDIYMNKQQWEEARRVLFWLQPRVRDDAHARSLADLAVANLELKKLHAAAGWVSRGLAQHKDFTWTDAGTKMTFAMLRARIASAGGEGFDGRFPTWGGDRSPPELDFVAKDGNTQTLSLADQPHAQIEGQQLLAPVETSPALRSPNLLFVRTRASLSVYDTDKGEFTMKGIALPRNTDAVLLGVNGDTAVILQSDVMIGLNLKTRETWTADLPLLGNAPRVGTSVVTGNTRTLPNGTQVEVNNGIIYVNGSPYAQAGSITLLDENHNPFLGSSGNDPDGVRRAAFAPLGSQVHFTTAGILNGKVYILAGNQLDAYNVRDGSAAWVGRDGKKVSAILPTGNAMYITGNEDLIVAQVDSTDGKSSTFCAFDGESGHPGKQFKLDDEHANWRALGDDGMLFVVTNRAVAAYDMMSASGGAAWRKTSIGSRYASATALTLDGLVVITDENGVQCLALDSGETQWTGTLPSTLTSGSNAPASMHAMVVTPNADARHEKIKGDLIVLQSADGCAAFESERNLTPVPDDSNPQRVWEVTKITELPPRQSIQFYDGMLIEQMGGSVKGGAGRTIEFGARDLSGGKLGFNRPLADADPLRSWQAVDNGIAIDMGQTTPGASGRIFFIKAKKQ